MPPRRWDTAKAVGVGLILGLIAAPGYVYLRVHHPTLVVYIVAMLAGPAAGAAIFGLVVELRNRLLGAV
jgi:hypothetical protein